jgi:hypothetical protein
MVLKNVIASPILAALATEKQCPLAELYGYNYAQSPFYYEACQFDELNRGSILGPKIDVNN